VRQARVQAFDPRGKEGLDGRSIVSAALSRMSRMLGPCGLSKLN